MIIRVFRDPINRWGYHMIWSFLDLYREVEIMLAASTATGARKASKPTEREREREGERESFICSIIICIDAREEERGGGINRGQEDVICFCLKSSWPFYYCFRDWKSLSKIINYTRGREREKEVVQWETNSILSNPGHHHADKLVRVSKTSLETLLTLGERPLSSICVSHSPHK